METFKGTPYDTGLDQKLLSEIADYFRPIRDEALDSGLLNPKNLGVNIKTLLYQVPGGMLSNLTSQLKEAECGRQVLRSAGGSAKSPQRPGRAAPCHSVFPDRGNPGSAQRADGRAVQGGNQRDQEDILSGKYGATVKPFNEEVKKKVLDPDTEIITCRPADLIPDELDTLRKEMEQWSQQDEDVLTYALFPQVAVGFLQIPGSTADQGRPDGGRHRERELSGLGVLPEVLGQL